MKSVLLFTLVWLSAAIACYSYGHWIWGTWLVVVAFATGKRLVLQ